MNPFSDNAEALQQRAIALIKPLIPPDAEDRVHRAYKEFRQIVRSHIRSETRLTLADEDTRENVPVKIVDGFPISIAQLIDNNQDRTLWRLILAPGIDGFTHRTAARRVAGFSSPPIGPLVGRRVRRRAGGRRAFASPRATNTHGCHHAVDRGDGRDCGRVP